MAKNKISEWSATPANNTDVGGIDIAEGCAPSGINNAIREMMAQVKDMVTGADGDNLTVGGNLVVTGTATGVSPLFGDNSTKLSTTAFVQDAVAALHPIGSIYIAVISTNPATLFGFGTWVAFGAGKTLVGLNNADASFDTVEETGGSKDAVVVSHTHTASVTDSGHVHNYATKGVTSNQDVPPIGFTRTGGTLDMVVNSSISTTGISVSNSTTGVSGTNGNLQPYIVVYMWKRTA